MLRPGKLILKICSCNKQQRPVIIRLRTFNQAITAGKAGGPLSAGREMEWPEKFSGNVTVYVCEKKKFPLVTGA